MHVRFTAMPVGGIVCEKVVTGLVAEVIGHVAFETCKERKVCISIQMNRCTVVMPPATMHVRFTAMPVGGIVCEKVVTGLVAEVIGHVAFETCKERKVCISIQMNRCTVVMPPATMHVRFTAMPVGGIVCEKVVTGLVAEVIGHVAFETCKERKVCISIQMNRCTVVIPPAAMHVRDTAMLVRGIVCEEVVTGLIAEVISTLPLKPVKKRGENEHNYTVFHWCGEVGNRYFYI